MIPEFEHYMGLVPVFPKETKVSSVLKVSRINSGICSRNRNIQHLSLHKKFTDSQASPPLNKVDTTVNGLHALPLEIWYQWHLSYRPIKKRASMLIPNSSNPTGANLVTPIWRKLPDKHNKEDRRAARNYLFTLRSPVLWRSVVLQAGTYVSYHIYIFLSRSG
jgi:hypothetical protein